ncbi:GAF domain-containing protein [Roseomonas sp. HF4]|uniref:GAF domain-containing protein n=1 Tax=Roseomonas sp. HF4 TaxID=2562313 RepID=UPI00148588B7|nr:GAF domain-containing protein [Roseomonas sp. HF4]
MTGRPGAGDFAVALAAAARSATAATDVEAALRGFADAARDAIGDHGAAARPGALQEGELDYRVAGVFLVTPDGAYNMLAGSVGFPPEQRRLMIPLAWNHPGRVVAAGRSILIGNTDEEAGRFRQFLKSSRMGSSLYAPFFAEGRVAGQLVAAAQARGTYDAEDLARIEALAATLGLAWRALDGAAWLARDYPAPDAWRAEDHVTGESIS